MRGKSKNKKQKKGREREHIWILSNQSFKDTAPR